MKIFTGIQIREIDALTIKYEPVSSIDLMERAAGQLYNWISGRYGISEHFIVFAGPGNNGGDGLALARILRENGYSVDIYCIASDGKRSGDWELNRKRLEDTTDVIINSLTETGRFPLVTTNDIIIDAIYGTGLTRPVEGIAGNIIRLINHSEARVISVDIPSGLFPEDNKGNIYDNIVKADFTLSFQFPKLSFMFAENYSFTGEWIVLPIGLDEKAIRSIYSPYKLLVNSDIAPLIRSRNKFDHKGNFGHGLLIAGSAGKTGAAVLAGMAALRTGIGLLTCHIPSCGNVIMQTSIPEAMVISDKSETHFSGTGCIDSFNALGIGPGLGTEPDSQNALKDLLLKNTRPMVIDADALNILSIKNELIGLLPSEAILTPHLKEFERLAGSSVNSYERLKLQTEFSRVHNCIIILKGAHTSVTTPEGDIYFNSTGNPGMATGGSGDVLTGIILSLLAQGYTPGNAAITAVYLHGLAGDLAARELCFESIIASDIINCIGKAFNWIRKL